MGEGFSRESAWRRSRIVIRVPGPAAGADWLATVPAGHTWRLLSVFAQLVTSAVVATRLPQLAIGDGVGSFLTLPVGSGQAASLTARYSLVVSPPAVTLGTLQLGHLPDLTLQAGWTIGTSTVLVDVADQWSGVALNIIDTTVRDGAVDVALLPDFLVEIVTSAKG